MNYFVLTLFPEMIQQAADSSVLGRAIHGGIIGLDTINIRDFSQNKYNRVDEYPYGGGAGMVMEAEPVYQAVEHALEKIDETHPNPPDHNKTRVIYFTPQAKVLTQTQVEEYAREEDLILLCGHYEGVDERVLERVVTDYVSIGDYVLTGGELGALVFMDAVSRFCPGVLGNEDSVRFESHQEELLEYPQYTRPPLWREMRVPEVLLSGDHQKIEDWRYEQAVKRTKDRRPDLIKRYFRIHLIEYGTVQQEIEGQHPSRMLLETLTAQGEILDYSRKKIQRQRRIFGDHDLVILNLDSFLLPESKRDNDENFKENSTRLPEMPEVIFRNLTGTGTFVYLVGDPDRDDTVRSGDNSLDDGKEAGIPKAGSQESFTAFLESRGFKVADAALLSADQIRTYALKVRRDMEKANEEIEDHFL